MSLPICTRISPSRSRFRVRSSSSSSRGAGARRQNSCLYLSLAWQKQRWQEGHILLGSLGSCEHQGAAMASNSPRQFQQMAGWRLGDGHGGDHRHRSSRLSSPPRSSRPPLRRGERRRGRARLPRTRAARTRRAGDGRAPEEALHLVAAERAEEGDLGLVLHSLGHHLHVQAVGHRDHRRHERGVVGIGGGPRTKARSILRRSMGSRRRWASEEKPAPKPSMARLTPRSPGARAAPPPSGPGPASRSPRGPRGAGSPGSSPLTDERLLDVGRRGRAAAARRPRGSRPSRARGDPRLCQARSCAAGLSRAPRDPSTG